MADDDVKQRLAAILAADVAGYSRLMGEDEPATVAALRGHREVFRQHIEANGGRVVDMAGDSVLAVFDSTAGAVAAAMATQKALGESNDALPDERQMRFRIGVNLGDIREADDGTVYGDGVNVAARLEGLAEPGGICVSDKVHAEVHGKLDLGFADLGEHAVKNITEPVRAYRVLAAGETAPKRRGPRKLPAAVLAGAAAVVALAIVIGVVFWHTGEPEDSILAMPTGPTIAVLPFDNMSGDPEQDYFSDGITEEIITELSRRSNLFVIARNSTFRYKGQSVDVRQVGQELGARYVLEGSVRKAGGTIRVTVQLLASTDGKHLWAETYERELSGENLFDVQDQITENVVGAIGGAYGAIHRAGLAAARSKAPSTLEAYDCVLRAISMLRGLSPQLHLSARNCLETAVEQEPDYAEAWAWLSYVYHFEYSLGFNPQPNSLERGLMAAQQAVRLDSAHQLGHQQLAYNYFLTKQQRFFEKAEEAIAINPNNPDVIGALGYYLSYAGKWERGAALIHKAIALNPDILRSVYSPLSAYAYVQRDYDEALRWAQKIEIPPWWKNHALLAISYGQLGMQDEVSQSVNDLLAVNPSFAENARQEFRKYFWDETELEHVMDGLRKAGLDIPDEAQVGD
jgi:adenylate cyclase